MFFKKKEYSANTTPSKMLDDLNVRLSVISEVNKALVGVIDQQKVFDLITQKLARSVNMIFPSIWLYDPTTQTIRLTSHSIPKSLSKIAELSIKSSIESISFSRNNSEQAKSTYFRVIESGKPIFGTDLYAPTHIHFFQNQLQTS